MFPDEGLFSSSNIYVLHSYVQQVGFWEDLQQLGAVQHDVGTWVDLQILLRASINSFAVMVLSTEVFDSVMGNLTFLEYLSQ